jgi:hypothetical protein
MLVGELDEMKDCMAADHSASGGDRSGHAILAFVRWKKAR